jgi:hypothetical protein
VEFSGVPAGHSSNHPAGGTSAATQGYAPWRRSMTMYENWNTEEFFKRFKITCLKCGSENVKISGDQGWAGTDVTAGDPATLAIGCNDCKQNDFDFSA